MIPEVMDLLIIRDWLPLVTSVLSAGFLVDRALIVLDIPPSQIPILATAYQILPRTIVASLNVTMVILVILWHNAHHLAFSTLVLASPTVLYHLHWNQVSQLEIVTGTFLQGSHVILAVR